MSGYPPYTSFIIRNGIVTGVFDPIQQGQLDSQRAFRRRFFPNDPFIAEYSPLYRELTALAAANAATCADQSPAKEKAIEGLEKARVDEKFGDVGPCPVCLEEFLIGDEARRLPCSHIYHAGCIVEWLKKRDTCPVCRRDFQVDDVNLDPTLPAVDDVNLNPILPAVDFLFTVSLNSQTIYPLFATAHPQEPNQLALGLTDGSVKVIEPSEAEKWRLPVPVDNGTENGRTATSSTTNTSEQLQR
ncbi:hypothetical protein PTKIN_Ptkin16aG0068000 [Pterospermum kingtungense]